MKKLIRVAWKIYIRILNILKLPFNKQLYISESYFPELSENRKTVLRRFAEQFIYILKYGYPNKFYFLYGLDIKNLFEANSYVDYNLFMRTRNRLNNVSSPHSTVGILRNKFLFGLVAESLNVPTPENIGIIENGELFILKSKTYVNFKEWILENNIDVFVKSISGECGDGVYHLIADKSKTTIDGEDVSLSRVIDVLGTGKYILQRTLVQHPKITALHPKAVNTIRLETVYDKKNNKIEILPPLLRVGVGENNVDNWAAGGLAIGIDTNNNTLKKYGFYKPGFGTKAAVHPSTDIIFEGYEIPYLQEAISCAKRFHSYLSDIHSIGWDIAITEDGPCIIEGNDNWEISLVQISNYGLQKEFDDLFQ